MIRWDPWRGCHRCSEGCRYCYLHKGDKRRKTDTNQITKTSQFDRIVQRKKDGTYKVASNQEVALGFSTDFLIEEADAWRESCYEMMMERSDLSFLFLTKRIERYKKGLPDHWGEGLDNLSVGVSVENQHAVDTKIPFLLEAPFKTKLIICQPMIAPMNLEPYLASVDGVIVGGESDVNGRILDYRWVLDIREQCIKHQVSFTFRQCATHFLKEGVLYTIPYRQLSSQAHKANINYTP